MLHGIRSLREELLKLSGFGIADGEKLRYVLNLLLCGSTVFPILAQEDELPGARAFGAKRGTREGTS